MRTFWRWWPAIVMMTAIFLFSAIPSNEMISFGWLDLLIKKGGHMCGYALLGATLWRAVFNEKKSGFLFPFIMTIAFAVSDEFHQSFVPGRNAAWIDVGIDSLGAGLGLLWIAKNEWLRKILLWKLVR